MRVLPLVEDAAPRTRDEVLFSAAQLVYLGGLTALDNGQCGVGQRHFIHALRLAGEARDRAFAANILAAMATAAAAHRHSAEAVQLARAGLVTARRVGHPALLMRLFIAPARALAVCGDHQECIRSMMQAELALDRASDPGENHWTRFLDQAYLLGETAACFVELGRPADAVTVAEQSAAANGGRQRRLVLSHALRATALGQAGELDQAEHALHHALDLAGPIQSSRSLRALHEASTAITRLDTHSTAASRTTAIVGRLTRRCCPQP